MYQEWYLIEHDVGPLTFVPVGPTRTNGGGHCQLNESGPE